MAVHTFYLTNTLATTPDWFGILQDGGTAPTAAVVNASNTIGTLAIGSFARMPIAGAASASAAAVSATSFIDGKTAPQKGTAATLAGVGDSMRSPATLTGTFASGNWVLTFGITPSVATARGRMRVRVWHGTNIDGTSATEVTTSTQVGTTTPAMSVVGTVYTSTVTWAAPSFTVNSEYLFFQTEYQEDTSAGTGSTTRIRGEIGSATNFVTTDLGAIGASLVWQPQPFQHMIIR